LDLVTGFTDDVVMAIAGDMRPCRVVLSYHQFDLAAAINHDRAATQGVGVHGYQNNGIHLGMHQRSASAERIGGGASRRGDDEAVRMLGVNELIINIELEFDHANE